LAEKALSAKKRKGLAEVAVLGETHRTVNKNFETEMWVDGQRLLLNHFVQETIANIILGFSKTLKGLDSVPEKIEVKIKKLHKPVKIDAHTYP
jgi:hypothetical protein